MAVLTEGRVFSDSLSPCVVVLTLALSVTDGMPYFVSQELPRNNGSLWSNQLVGDLSLSTPDNKHDADIATSGPHATEGGIGALKSVPLFLLDDCLKTGLKMCDIGNLVRAHTTMNFCQTIEALQSCLSLFTNDCESPDGLLFRSSLGYLMAGYQDNGFCTDLPHGLNENGPAATAGKSHLCVPDEIWDCGEQLIVNMLLGEATCQAMNSFHSCLQTHTSDCAYGDSRNVLGGVSGILWTYRKLRLCNVMESPQTQ